MPLLFAWRTQRGAELVFYGHRACMPNPFQISGTIGATNVFLKIADLGKLRELIATAKSRLDAIKVGVGG